MGPLYTISVQYALHMIYYQVLLLELGHTCVRLIG